MLKMSFYNGTLDRKKADEFIAKTEKPLKYTNGLSYRRPATHNKPITKEYTRELIKNYDLLDITEYEDYIHFNTYSSNDMW